MGDEQFEQAAEDELTIDELARRADTRTSTVRLYQTRGLVPPPRTRARVGYYSSAHLARLRLIQRLQRRGYSLAAIKELLDNWARGASLGAVLGTESEVADIGQPEELSLADFAALFPDGQVDEKIVRRSVALGLASFDATTGRIRVPSRAFLEVGRELAAYNVPPARAIDEFELLSSDAKRIAERFVALFREYVAVSAESAAERDELSERFLGLASTAVLELVRHALDAANHRDEG